MSTFFERLEELRKSKGISQGRLEKELGFSNGSISKWKNSSPTHERLQKLADYFGVSTEYLITGEAPAGEPAPSDGVWIPVLGRIAAGIPIEAITDILDYEQIPNELARTGEFFSLQIHGDSMEPRICDGDIIIARQQSDAESGEIVVVQVNGDMATCKRLKKYADGIALLSINPHYDPMYFSNREIAEKPVSILGKVVELRGKF